MTCTWFKPSDWAPSSTGGLVSAMTVRTATLLVTL